MCMYANWIISKVHINCAVNSVFSESVVLSPNVSLTKYINNNLFFAISCFFRGKYNNYITGFPM